MAPLRLAGLFAGIGGIELGFQNALGDNVQTDLLCEWWEPAKTVLAHHFPGTPLHPDVRTLRSLPRGLDVLAAGFPCTDLSQAGRTAGISGEQSGLITHVFAMLRRQRRARQKMPWILIENVPNMLALDRGRAMQFLVEELESLGYSWAYRVVDSRFTGVPQRRRRVLLVASVREDPRDVLFPPDAGDLDHSQLASTAYGFYWTEGRGGLGWAQDAVPTLKGGSTIGIPSPPAIWVPDAEVERSIVTPRIEDAEALQGFPRGWTDLDLGKRSRGTRWKLVGNAVTARVAAWVAERICNPTQWEGKSTRYHPRGAWPTAAWGHKGQSWTVQVSEFPEIHEYESLSSIVDLNAAPPLSTRAINGFQSRLLQGNLGRAPGFRDAIAAYAQHRLLADSSVIPTSAPA